MSLRKKSIRAINITALVLVLVALVPLVVSLLVDINFYKPMVEQRASRALGAKVSIAKLEASFFPLFKVTALEVKAGDLVTADQIKAGVRLLPLITGKVEVSDLTVAGFDLNGDEAQRLFGGAANTSDTEGKARGEATGSEARGDAVAGVDTADGGVINQPKTFLVPSIYLENGTIGYCGGSAKCHRLEVVSLDIQLPTGEVAGDIRFGNFKMGVDGKLSKTGVDLFLKSKQVALTLQARPNSSGANYKGSIRAEGDSIQGLIKSLAASNLIASPSMALLEGEFLAMADLETDLQQVELTNLTLALAERQLTGYATLARKGYQLRLAGKNVVLDPQRQLEGLTVLLEGDYKSYSGKIRAQAQVASLEAELRAERLQFSLKGRDLPRLLEWAGANIQSARNLPKQFEAQGVLDPKAKTLNLTSLTLEHIKATAQIRLEQSNTSPSASGSSASKSAILAGGVYLSGRVNRLNLDNFLNNNPEFSVGGAGNGAASGIANGLSNTGEVPFDSQAFAGTPLERLTLDVRADELVYNRQTLNNVALDAVITKGKSYAVRLNSLSIKGGLAENLSANGNWRQNANNNRLSLQASNLNLAMLSRLMPFTNPLAINSLPFVEFDFEGTFAKDFTLKGKTNLPRAIGGEGDFAVTKAGDSYEVITNLASLNLPFQMLRMAKSSPQNEATGEAKGEAAGDATNGVTSEVANGTSTTTTEGLAGLAPLLGKKGSLKLRVERLNWDKSLTFGNVVAMAELKPASLAVKRLTATFGEGELSAFGNLSFAKAEGEITATALKAKYLNLKMGKRGIEQGIVNGNAKFAFSPVSAASTLATNGRVSIENPIVRGINLAKINQLLQGKQGIGGVVNLLQVAVGGGTTAFTRFATNFSSKNGKFIVDPLLEGNEANGSGQFSINLPQNTIDGRMDIRPSVPDTPSLKLSVKGRLSAPQVFLDDGELAQFILNKSVDTFSSDNLEKGFADGLGEDLFGEDGLLEKLRRSVE